MLSELRQDLVSGDWIVIAPRRGKRPHGLVTRAVHRARTPIAACPFEPRTIAAAGAHVARYPENGAWQAQIIENKYPAFTHRNICAAHLRRGPYAVVEGVGHHELLVTRDHHASFAHLHPAQARLVFRAFRDRYRTFLKDSCLAYVSLFQNWGPKAGASVYHPHYQIIAIPVVPSDVEHSLRGSHEYFAAHKTCVHCTMVAWERKEKRRIVYENAGAVAVAPFVSREPFELRIFPKRHLPYFEDTSEQMRTWVVDALQKALLKIEKRLYDPDYNFFIHTAPLRRKSSYRHYHWHIEVLPKISISAGFELGTGIEITVVDPDDAARMLR